MTLFPEMIENVLGESIIGRARKAGLVEVVAHNIRNFSTDCIDPHGTDLQNFLQRRFVVAAVPFQIEDNHRLSVHFLL